MGESLGFQVALSSRVIMTIFCLACLWGCSDPQAKDRARLCEGAGVAVDLVKECRRSWEDYNRIMKPIAERLEHEEITAFNLALRALPPRAIPKARYESTSLAELSKALEPIEMSEVSNWTKHPIFGRQFRVNAVLQFHATDFESRLSEHTSLGQRDANDASQIEVDTESLSREERAFAKTQCDYVLQECHGEVFGVVGVVTRDQIPHIGLQLEHMEIKPRALKKSS